MFFVTSNVSEIVMSCGNTTNHAQFANQTTTKYPRVIEEEIERHVTAASTSRKLAMAKHPAAHVLRSRQTVLTKEGERAAKLRPG